MFLVVLCLGVVHYLPRLLMVRSPLDTVSALAIPVFMLLMSEAFSKKVNRFLISLGSVSLCAAYTIGFANSAFFDVSLPVGFLFWLLVGISFAQEEVSCNPLQPVL